MANKNKIKRWAQWAAWIAVLILFLVFYRNNNDSEDTQETEQTQQLTSIEQSSPSDINYESVVLPRGTSNIVVKYKRLAHYLVAFTPRPFE